MPIWRSTVVCEQLQSLVAIGLEGSNIVLIVIRKILCMIMSRSQNHSEKAAEMDSYKLLPDNQNP